MAATATKVPFSDASPAEIREVLLPEELPQFEQDYAEALRQAREEYRLDKLEVCLRSWRRIAWMTASDPKAHRLMLQRAQYTLSTGGDILPGSRLVSQEEMEERLRARLAAGQVYRVNPYEEAMASIEALPYAAALGYAEALGVLKLAPWSGKPLREDNPDGNIRTLAFGPGGLVTYLILEDQRRVDVLQVHWVG